MQLQGSFKIIMLNKVTLGYSTGPYLGVGGGFEGVQSNPLFYLEIYFYCKMIFSTVICVLAFIIHFPWLLPAEPHVASRY